MPSKHILLHAEPDAALALAADSTGLVHSPGLRCVRALAAGAATPFGAALVVETPDPLLNARMGLVLSRPIRNGGDLDAAVAMAGELVQAGRWAGCVSFAWECADPSRLELNGDPALRHPMVRMRELDVYELLASPNRSAAARMQGMTSEVGPEGGSAWSEVLHFENATTHLGEDAQSMSEVEMKHLAWCARQGIMRWRAAWNGDRLLGVAACIRVADAVMLANVFTHPSARGLGVASTLCAEWIEQMRHERPDARIVLKVAPRSPAISIYRRLGFRRTGYFRQLTVPV